MTERRKLWILVLCCIGQFMVILDVSVVNVALPSIRSGLHFSPADLQWVVNAYTLTFAGFLLLGGRACDLLVRRNVFNFGMALFALASLVGGLAQSQEMLVIARGIQGLGRRGGRAGHAFDHHEHLHRGRRAQQGARGLGRDGRRRRLRGRPARRVLTQLLSWRWILFINVPIGAVTALAAMRVIAADRPESPARRNFDLAGAITGTLGLIVMTFGIVKTEQYGWGSARTLITLGIAVLLLGRLPRDRVALRQGAAHAAAHLQVAAAQRGQRRRAAARQLGVRDVVLRLALPAGGPRLHADPDRGLLPTAGDRAGRGLAGGGQAARDAWGPVGSSSWAWG